MVANAVEGRARAIHAAALSIAAGAIAVGAMAADSVLFEPIVAGSAATAVTKNPPPSDAWPGWCGVRVRMPLPPIAAGKFAGQSYLTLVDGQRLAGIFELGNAKPSWRNSTLQSVPIDLEQTQSIGPIRAGSEPAAAKDSVLLVNNDRLEGFIDSMDVATGVALEVSAPPASPSEKPAKQVRRIPMERIAEIRLATKTRPAEGWRIWLADGSVIDVDSWSDEHNQCLAKKPRAVMEMEGFSMPWGNVLAIAPNTNTIAALANCPWKVSAVPDEAEFRLAPPVISSQFTPAAFDAAPLDLHGPGVFQFSLPQSRGTLAATLQVPPQLKGVVGCRATIECGGKALWQGTLTPDFQSVDVRLPVDGGELAVRLDQPRRGAFGCALRLTDAILISESCGTQSPPTHHPTTAPARPGS